MGKRKVKTKSEEEILSLIPEAELQAREQRHIQRLNDLSISLGFIRDACNEYNQLQSEQVKLKHWERYTRCDGLPRPQSPPEIRRFIVQGRHFEHIDEDALINWLLSVDERSILSQNIFRTDLTRKALLTTLCPNIGAVYDRCVQRILAVIEQINTMLENDMEVSQYSLTRCIEIVYMRKELQKEIDVFFDKLTYRVISANGAYMASKDAKVATYCYKCDNYSFQIWGLRDIPIRFKHMDLPIMVANLDCTGVHVQLPLSVLVDNITLRCVHTVFDPYTESAKSYECVIDRPTNDLNAGMVDIDDCLVNEWLTQLDIQEELVEKIMNKLRVFQETMEAFDAKEKAGAKERAEDPKKAKVLKPPKEPQSLPIGMWPDPLNLFLEREQKQYLEFLDEFFHPIKLELRPDEINLRRFIMLGGVFSVIFVRKPKHTAFEKFNITLHEDGHVLVKLLDVVADLTPEEGDESNMGPMLSSISRAGSRVPQSRSRSRMQMEGQTRTRSRFDLAAQSAAMTSSFNLFLSGDEAPYFFVTFKLPKHLCLWGEPVACQFVEEEVDDYVEDLPQEEPVVLSKKGKKKNKRKKSKEGSSSRETSPTREDKSKQETEISEASDTNKSVESREVVKIVKKTGKKGDEIQNLDVEHPTRFKSVIVPRTTEPLNIYRSSVLATLRRATRAVSILPGVAVHNFVLLNRPLRNPNLRMLERHLVPRILSSFKFPLEFREEYEEEQAALKQQRLNALSRRPEEVIPEPSYNFNFEEQMAPERLYPIFEHREHVTYTENIQLYDDDDRSEVEDVISIREGPVPDDIVLRLMSQDAKEVSFFDALNTFNNIQAKYESNFKRVFNQVFPTIKVKTPKHVVTPDTITQTIREHSQSRSKSALRGVQRKSKAVTPAETEVAPTAKGSNDTLNRETEVLPPSEGTPRRSGQSARDTKSITSDEVPQGPPKPRVVHWTTKHVHETIFDRQQMAITVKTDRLGTFGFAYKRYAHFPFRQWTLEPNPENPEEIRFTLDTFYVRVILNITRHGVSGYVTDLIKEYVVKPVKYLTIEEPISDFRELKKRFLDKNVNIFAEHDAGYYIENGYFCQKHLATELHVYDAMALHCKLMKFMRSDWNRLATRRNVIITMRNPRDPGDFTEVTARVTPDNSTFVEIQELCSDDLDVFKLQYTPTWRNIGIYSDLHQLINSMYPQATDIRNRDPNLIYLIRKLLTEVRPLSYS